VGVAIREVKLLSPGQATTKSAGDALTIDVPAGDRDPVVTVIQLTVDGKAFDIPTIREFMLF